MVARMAWPRYIKEPGIVPVIVDFITERNFQGTIRVSLLDSDSAPVLEQDFNVGGDPQRKGGGFRFEIPYPITNDPSSKNELLVTLLEGRRTMDKQKIPLTPLNPGMGQVNNMPMVMMASNDPSKPEYLVGVLAVRRYDLNIADNAQGSFTTVPLDPKYIPSDWRMYEGLDLLIVMGNGATAIGPRQCVALSQWVQAGGRLLISADCMPAGRSDLPFARFFDCGEIPKEVTRARFGLGQIARIPQKLGVIQQSVGTEKAKQFGKILEQTNLFRDAPVGDSDYGYSYYDQRQVPLWAHHLRDWTQFDRIPRWLVVIYLLVFSVIVLVVERVVLGLIKKRHWTWVTTIATVALFCYAASYISTAIRGRRSRFTVLTLHDFGYSSGGRHISIAAFTPARSKTFAAVAPPGSITMRHNYGMFSTTKTIIRMNPQSLQFAHPVWSTTYLTSITPHISDSPFKADLTYVDGELTGTVTTAGIELDAKQVFCRVGHKLFERIGKGRWQEIKDTDDFMGSYYYYDGARPADVALADLTKAAAFLKAPAGTVQMETAPQPEYDKNGDPIPITEVIPEYGLIVAVVRDGPGIQIDAEDPIKKELHIVRQLAELKTKPSKPTENSEED